MLHLNAYPINAIAQRNPLRNQTPNALALKQAIAKKIYQHYGIPCWVQNAPAIRKINGVPHYSVYITRHQDLNGNPYLYCNQNPSINSDKPHKILNSPELQHPLYITEYNNL